MGEIRSQIGFEDLESAGEVSASTSTAWGWKSKNRCLWASYFPFLPSTQTIKSKEKTVWSHRDCHPPPVICKLPPSRSRPVGNPTIHTHSTVFVSVWSWCVVVWAGMWLASLDQRGSASSFTFFFFLFFFLVHPVSWHARAESACWSFDLPKPHWGY